VPSAKWQAPRAQEAERRVARASGAMGENQNQACQARSAVVYTSSQYVLQASAWERRGASVIFPAMEVNKANFLGKIPLKFLFLHIFQKIFERFRALRVRTTENRTQVAVFM
jgi:hypothetical protein